MIALFEGIRGPESAQIQNLEFEVISSGELKKRPKKSFQNSYMTSIWTLFFKLLKMRGLVIYKLPLSFLGVFFLGANNFNVFSFSFFSSHQSDPRLTLTSKQTKTIIEVI